MDSLLKFIEALGRIPLAILAGLAIAGTIILSLPKLVGLDFGPQIDQWSGYLWTATIVAWCCTATNLGAQLYGRWLRPPSYHFRPLPLLCWWHAARQRDGATHSQLCADIEVSNLTDRLLRVVAARLVLPRVQQEDLTHASVSTLPRCGYANFQAEIGPHKSDRIRVQFMVARLLQRTGRVLSVRIELTLDPPETTRVTIRFRPQ